MKQRVVVQAIIQSGDKTLFLRRSQGRPAVVGKYELPGGTIDDNEQPDDAMRRHLKNDLGITDAIFDLKDVMSMIDREEGDIQHIFIVYAVNDVNSHFTFRTGRSYDKYEWIKKSEIQQYELRDSALYLLDLDASKINIERQPDISINSGVKNTSKESQVIVYSDGGSRGNPGPSAAAFVIVNNDIVVGQGGEYLGITTNNQAEYHGVRLGLERALELNVHHIEFRIDSMLVVNQLNGLYKIKNRELWPINERVQALLSQFESVTFKHVPRELNTMADALVNKFLDEHKNNS
jgi:ribonuclease HI/ADP-ribose pyrophosphatase YjhB (NUDIX family)